EHLGDPSEPVEVMVAAERPSRDQVEPEDVGLHGDEIDEDAIAQPLQHPGPGHRPASATLIRSWSRVRPLPSSMRARAAASSPMSTRVSMAASEEEWSRPVRAP